MGHVYIAQVRVRHDELDAFGRAYPSAYLRHLAQVAIDASSDAGFDARWYAAAGAQWLVRRTTFAVPRPWRAESELSVRTWVEDFRRVRSRRCYEASQEGEAALTAQTDWVFVDVATGRPRRVPEEMEARFGMAVHAGRPRTPWRAPAPPPAPGRSTYRVRWAELDALGHMNNAAYLDLLVQGTLDVLDGLGWPVDRLAPDGVAPYVSAGDVEYLDEVRHGDRLEILTWFTAAADGLDVHQRGARVVDARPVVQANTSWRWSDVRTDAAAQPPPGLVAALRPLQAA
ncbi:MAG TPA: thioesterase family protein [Candidatus Binatia bacterium]|nr:thioesterase family protein [Candidatus Binatia bacterium]